MREPINALQHSCWSLPLTLLQKFDHHLQGYPPYEWALLVQLLVDVYLLIAPIGFIRKTFV